MYWNDQLGCSASALYCVSSVSRCAGRMGSDRKQWFLFSSDSSSATFFGSECFLWQLLCGIFCPILKPSMIQFQCNFLIAPLCATELITLSNIWNLLISVIHNNCCTYSCLACLQDLVHIERVTHLSQCGDEFTRYSPICLWNISCFQKSCWNLRILW